MDRRGLVAGACVLLATTVSCASATSGDKPPAVVEPASGEAEREEPTEDPDPELEVVPEVVPEVPLELTLDHVDVSHGAMRLRATMAEGSPDVAIVLGDGCDGREVGRGFATRVSLVWSLDEGDVADALRCNLVVRVHAWSDQGRVVETAVLEVAPDVATNAVAVTKAVDDEDTAAEDVARPELFALGRDPEAMSLSFRSLTAAATLAIADRRIARDAPDAPDGGDDEVDDSIGTFDVPYATFARALLDDRPLRIDGTAFATSLSFAGVALERDAPPSAEAPSEETPTEEATETTDEVAAPRPL